MKKNNYHIYIDEGPVKVPAPPEFDSIRQKAAARQKSWQQKLGQWGTIIPATASVILLLSLALVYNRERKKEVLPVPAAATAQPENIADVKSTVKPRMEAIHETEVQGAFPAPLSGNPAPTVADAMPAEADTQTLTAPPTPAPVAEIIPVETGTRFSWQAVPETDFVFDVQKGASIYLSSGTVISIPPNALMQGNTTAQGKAILHFREFNHGADLLTSGVNLFADSAGKTFRAGCNYAFEIGFSSAGVVLSIADGMEVRVKPKAAEGQAPGSGYRYNVMEGRWNAMEVMAELPATGNVLTARHLRGYLKVKNPVLRILGYQYKHPTANPKWIRTRDLTDFTPDMSGSARTRSSTFAISESGIYGQLRSMGAAQAGPDIILQSPMAGTGFMLFLVSDQSGYAAALTEQWPASFDPTGLGKVHFLAVSTYGKHAFLSTWNTSGPPAGWVRLPMVPRNSDDIKTLIK